MNRDRMMEVVSEILADEMGAEAYLKSAAERIVEVLRPADRKVVLSIESPYRPPEELRGTGEWLIVLRRNVMYARALYRKALLEGFAPFASHLNYAQPGVLNDEDEAERWLGIDSGKAVERAAAEQSWFGLDFPLSVGMRYGMEDAVKEGRVVREVLLGKDWETKWLGPTRIRPI